MPLVLAARYFNTLDAGAAQALLESAGIESVLFDTNMSLEGMGGAIPIRLMVLDEDLPTAQRVLAAEPKG